MAQNKLNAVLLVSLLISMLSGCGGATSISEPTRSSGVDSQAQLLSISISPSDPSIAANTGQQFTATGIYTDNTSRDLTDSVTWSSSDADVAEISSTGGTFSDSTTQNSMSAATMYSRGHVYSKRTGRTFIKAHFGSISNSTTLTVTNATLVSLAITPANPSIAIGTNLQFTAVGTFSDNTTQDLTAQTAWTSSNTGAATISASGLAAAAAAGSTTISAASGSITGSTALTVNPATLVSLAITPANSSIAKGTSQQFTAMGTYSDNSTQDLTSSVTWISSNTGIATISASGLAAAVAAGSTTISAASGNITGSSTLTVNSSILVSLAVTPTNPSIAKGTTQQFKATGTFSDNTTQDLTTSAIWSSDSGAATISNAAGSKGRATGAATGSAMISAASGSISGSTTLTVTPATLVSITVTPANPSIAKGTTRQFTATGTYSDSTTQNLTTAVTWGSSNTGIATISNAAGSKGLAASVAAGSTTVTATSGSISGTTTLTVTPATLTSISVTPVNSSIASGTSQQFTATGAYSDGTTQNLTASVTWSSSNTSVAAISNATGSKGSATAITAGTTSITAISGGVSGTATLTVTAVTSTGSARLAWNAPTTNTDGTPLTDLAGYKIYYGTSSGNYTSTIDVGNTTTYTVANLTSGAYYFTVTSYDSSGIESTHSNEASKIIQ